MTSSPDPTGAASGETALGETALEDTALGETALEDTALGGTALEDTALGETALEDTPIPRDPSGPRDRPVQPARGGDRRLVAARVLLFVVAAAAAANILYFVIRFVLSSHAPALNAAFRVSSAPVGDPGGFSAVLAAIGGWRTTAARLILVSTSLLVIALVIAGRHGRDAMVQAFAAVCLLGGQLSLSVTVLTSSESEQVWRLLAVGMYLILPAVVLLVLSLSPDGKPRTPPRLRRR